LASIVSSVLNSAVASSLLFSTHGSSGSFKRNRNKRNRDKGSYTIKLKGLSDRITWFNDLPERKAGSEDIEDFIGGWNGGFPDGVNPNAALEFTDKNGESDVAVFEMFRPVYNPKRDTLKFRAKINDGQVLDGGLESHSVRADGKFTKQFSDSSLFIDNWVLKDTRLTINNNLQGDILLHPITFDKDGKTVGNYLVEILEGIGAGVAEAAGEVAVVVATGDAAMGPAALIGTAADLVLEGAGVAVGTAGAIGTAAAAIVALGIGFATVDAIQTKYHTVVDTSLAPTVIGAGQNFTIQDSESRWGFHNGVADIAFLVTTQPKTDPVTGITSGGIIGSVFYDNPAVGSTYAKIVSGGNPVPEELNDIDRIVLDSGVSRTIDFPGGYMTTTYDNSSGFLTSGTKDWTLDIFAN
jgi:hypothetical protein